MIFDNSKLRSVVPDYVATITLEQAAPEIIEWHDGDQSRQRLDADLDALMDKLSAEFRVRGSGHGREPVGMIAYAAPRFSGRGL